jgi:NodT family efflux transporter outer membrane factor (OMF) lipoprotein
MWMDITQGFLAAPRLKRVLVTIVTCGVLLTLPACGIPHLRQADPPPPIPPTFTGSDSQESSARLGIDQFYNDPTLTQLIYQGLAGNRELKNLEEEVQIAANEVRARSGAYLPFVSWGVGTGVDKPSIFTPEGAAEKQLEPLPGKRFPDPMPDFRLGLRFSWALDIWRELRNGRDAAAQRHLAAIERRNAFVTRLVADIAEGYYSLMALDKRIETLDQTIDLQEQSLKLAEAKKKAGRGTELAVQRFRAEVQKNQSEKSIVRQEIVEVENRINFLAGRFPQRVERASSRFIDLSIPALSAGLPAQMLENRPDIRQAEREIEAAGLEVLVARAHFFPRLDLTAGVGYRAFNPKYLFWTPDALIYNAAFELTAPLINKRAIQAEFQSANARQLQALYTYQRVVLDAFTEVVNRLAAVENYGRSIESRRQQLQSLAASAESANKLFLAARAEYVEVLLAQRELMEARLVLIDTKRKQLSAVVNAYQALGGGDLLSMPPATPADGPPWYLAPIIVPPEPVGTHP